jgi:hypothetical protein
LRKGIVVNQALVDQIVANVLAQLQPAPPRPVIEQPSPKVQPVPAAPRPQATELTAAVITADLLAATVRTGMALQIGRKSIVTPAARDWLHTNKVVWSRSGSVAPQTLVATEPTVKVVSVGKWQLVIQTVTANVRALQDAFKRRSDGWDIELVGQPHEAALAAIRSISTAERDGVVVISDFAEVIACRANRNARVRAAVITDRKQLELASQHLGVNLVCVNPQAKTFIELRNLLRDCAAMTPTLPAGWSE